MLLKNVKGRRDWASSSYLHGINQKPQGIGHKKSPESGAKKDCDPALPKAGKWGFPK